MSSYSFKDIQASINGPGLAAQIGQGAGSAEEGISVVYDDDKAGVITGADGAIMTSLHATMTGTMTFRLLKTSPINQVLNNAFNFQRNSAAVFGQNTVQITDPIRGDVCIGVQMAFLKHPDNAFAKDGNVLEWQFRGIVTETLGIGLPGVGAP